MTGTIFEKLRRARRATLAVWAAATLLALVFASRLHLDNSVLNLLPDDIPAVKTVRKLQSWHDMFAAVMYLGFVRDEATPVDTLKDFADAIGRRLQDSVWIEKRITVAMDVSRIMRAAPLFLDPEDLRTAGEQADSLVKAQRKERSGLHLGIDDKQAEDSPESVLQALWPRYAKRFQIDAKAANVGDGNEPAAHPSLDATPALRFLRTKLDRTGDRLFYISEDGRMLMFMFQPIFKTEDLAHYPDLARDVAAAIAAAREEIPGTAGIEVFSGGSYPVQWDQREQTLADALRSGIAALLLIIVVVVITVRQVRLVVLVLLTLLSGLALTAGLAAIFVGSVNIITVFLLAVLAGLGIDFGLYLATRFARLRRQGMDAESALSSAWQQTASPAFMGALTTMAVMLMLAFGQFRGFADLGKICALGIVAIYLGMYTLLPALLATFMVKQDLCRETLGQQSSEAPFTGVPRLFARGGLVLTLALSLTALATYGTGKLRFAYTGEELTVKNQRSLEVDRLILRHFGENVDRTMVLADDEAQALRIHQYFQDNFGRWETIARYESVFTFLPPPAAQAAALAEAGPLEKAVSRVAGRSDDPDTDFALKQIKKLSHIEPMAIDELPEIVKSTYLARDENGKVRGFMGAIFSNRWLWDFDQIRRFVAEVEAIRVDGKPLETTGRPQIFLNVVNIVRREAVLFSALGSILIVLMFWVQTRSLRFAGLATLPLGLGVLWLLGLMPLVSGGRMTLDFVNVVAFPILTGLGVSYGIHVVHSFRVHGSAQGALQVVARPVLGSAITTLIGWGSLLLASMNGMRSIGWIAVLGITAIVACTLLVLPLVIERLHRRGWLTPDLADGRAKKTS